MGRIYVLHSLSIKQPQIKPSTNTRTSKCIAVHKCEKETKLLCLKSWKGANRTLCPRMTQTANDEVSVFPTVTKWSKKSWCMYNIMNLIINYAVYQIYVHQMFCQNCIKFTKMAQKFSFSICDLCNMKNIICYWYSEYIWEYRIKKFWGSYISICFQAKKYYARKNISNKDVARIIISIWRNQSVNVLCFLCLLIF